MIELDNIADDGLEILVLRDKITGRTLAEIPWMSCKPWKSLDEQEFFFVTPSDTSLQCKGDLEKLLRSKEILSFLGV